MIFLRPTEGAKLLLRKWIEEMKEQPWSKQRKSNDQPAFNWALNKTAGQVCFCKVSSLKMHLACEKAMYFGILVLNLNGQFVGVFSNLIGAFG